MIRNVSHLKLKKGDFVLAKGTEDIVCGVVDFVSGNDVSFSEGKKSYTLNASYFTFLISDKPLKQATKEEDFKLNQVLHFLWPSLSNGTTYKIIGEKDNVGRWLIENQINPEPPTSLDIFEYIKNKRTFVFIENSIKANCPECKGRGYVDLVFTREPCNLCTNQKIS